MTNVKMGKNPKILIYGAGVIGSLYAVLFSEAGYDVSVYARGRRLSVLQKKGLLYSRGEQVRRADVRVIDALQDNDRYRFIFLTVRGDQVLPALKELRTNQSLCIVTMVNTILDYASWEEICGKGRILPAFPGAGGGIRDDVLEAALTPAIIQPTTFGEITGKKTKRTKALSGIFKRAGIPYEIVPDMHAWQLSHLGMVVPLGDACVDYSPMEEVWRDRGVMRRTAKEIRRNFNWFARRGMLSPAKFHLVRYCPTPLIAVALRWFLRSDMGEMFCYKHVRKAPGEMRVLHEELYRYMRNH